MESLSKILRKHKVKMTPNVREKLKTKDHQLDDSYETFRIKTKKSVTEEIPRIN